MNIEIRKLTPNLAEDYAIFFDITPHDNNVDAHKCYCVCWCNDDYEGKDFSSREKRRSAAIQYVKGSNIQGYLAYYNNEIIGWCNANTKSDCLKCCSWRRQMGDVPTEEESPDIKVKSVFCFTISPDMKRKGIATQLLERVCKDAADDGFDFVEAYTDKEPVDENINFSGLINLYKKCGFTLHYETKDKLIMRKPLKGTSNNSVNFLLV